MPHADALPIILLPVGTDDAALDACLAALDAGTPPGSRAWLIDDAQGGPRCDAILDAWLRSTPLQAEYTRRDHAIGASAHLDEALAICGEADVVVLAADSVPVPGWLGQLHACLARDASIGTATPWGNLAEAASWPRLDDVNALPESPWLLASALREMAHLHPELPAAGTHAVALRGRAVRRAGGLDKASFQSWPAALADLSLRLAGLGWRNVLCEAAFVGRTHEDLPGDGDYDALAARWPDWHARMAHFVMDDPLRVRREELAARLAVAEPVSPQTDLFA